jgi:hypothetical protein
MTSDLDRLDCEFALKTAPAARVAGDGFHLGGGPAERVLLAVVREWSLVRKFFRDGKLACWSADGARSVKGKRCEGCADRGRCSPRIRLALERIPGTGGGASPEDGVSDTGPKVITVELNYSSCRNFLAYARRIRGTDGDVSRVPTRLTVEPRGTWGEVRFEVDADLFRPVEPAAGAAEEAR